MAKEGRSIRLHPVLDDAVTKVVARLKTTRNFVVEAALAEYLKDELPPTFKPGMPFKEPE